MPKANVSTALFVLEILLAAIQQKLVNSKQKGDGGLLPLEPGALGTPPAGAGWSESRRRHGVVGSRGDLSSGRPDVKRRVPSLLRPSRVISETRC